MKGLRQIMHVSWTEKKTNEWILEKVGVKRDMLPTARYRKLSYYDHVMRIQGTSLEKEYHASTLSGSHRRGERMTRMNNITTWTNLPITDLLRKVEDRDGWRLFA